MANFTATVNINQTTSDALGNLAQSISQLALNGRATLDDVFAAGALDLAPYMASITKPRLIMVKLTSGTGAASVGATIDLDGLGVSTIKVRTLFFEVTTDVVADIAITLTETTRVQMVVMGDPT